MYNHDFFFQALIYLLAAVISVPIAKKMGMVSVLGYLLAGIVIGPYVLGLVGKEADDLMHFAEFGVVLMLFVIGLELEPALLWKMKKSIFGLGGLQVLVTSLIITGGAFFMGFSVNRAIGIGLILALSSTAIVLQILTEKGLLQNSAGRSAFSVLLFQDIMVVPILALIPLLASMNSSSVNKQSNIDNLTGVANLPEWAQLLVIVLTIAAIVFIGRFFAKYIFRVIAETNLHEVFTALALLLVIGIALAMDAIGLSPALGTFIAGVVLADSEYRHELESTIDPFKGLLLGLFFISVGASINFMLLVEQPFIIIGIVLLLAFLKLIILFMLGRLFHLKKGYEYLFAFLLAQSSEFAFVLISFSRQTNLFQERTAGLLLLIVTLSMALSPILLLFNEKAVSPILSKWYNKIEYDEVKEQDNPIIMAGFGRLGLVVGRLLLAKGYKITIIDSNPQNVDVLRKFGFKLYYGDVTRIQVLEKAGINKAKLLILSMAEYDSALKVAKFVKMKYPDVRIIARAKDIYHAFNFVKLNVSNVQREMFDSGLEMGIRALEILGTDRYEAYRAARYFKYHEQEVFMDLYEHWVKDKNKFIQESKRFSEQLNETLNKEKKFSIHESDCSWNMDLWGKERKKK